MADRRMIGGRRPRMDALLASSAGQLETTITKTSVADRRTRRALGSGWWLRVNVWM
jgi:hypothetical protein